MGDFLNRQHLAVAVEIKQVSLTAVSSDFYNYCFVIKPLAKITKHTMNRNQKNYLDASGSGVCVCGHHGCFILHSMADFQKGERLAN